jgi:hypothetical protein
MVCHCAFHAIVGLMARRWEMRGIEDPKLDPSLRWDDGE